MKIKFWENLDYEHRVLCIFILVHFVLWTVISMVRTVLPTDALEGIYWGSLHDFGTPKHPPFAGWITYLVYSIFKSDLSIYILSQSFILVGVIYLYRLAKNFLSTTQAILSIIIMEGCWVYSYITGYYGFNPDVILLCMLPLITYNFYNCMNRSKLSDWIKLGLFVGISFLNKYQTVLTLIPMVIWALIFRRNVFKDKKLYLSIVIAFLIFLPHLLWLINYDFFPLLYFEGELTDYSWWNHITAPLQFLVVQLSVIIGTLLIYALLKFKQKSSFVLIENYKDEKALFLILFSIFPLIIHLIMGLCAGGTMRPRWGFEFLYLTGVSLFYFFPTKQISRSDFNFAVKLSCAVMLIVLISLGTLLSVEKNYRSRYPVSTIYNDMKNVWSSKYDTPLKYFGGYIEWTLPLVIYGEDKTDCILDTNGYKNPWIDEKDLEKSGILIIDRTIEQVQNQTKKSCPYLPYDYEIVPVEYKFKVYNAFKQPREYTIYYFIVPPQVEN